MSSLNRHLKTIFLPQSIAPAGKRAAELTPYEMGLMNCDTQRTVDVATYAVDQVHEIVLGSASNGMQNSQFPDQRGAKLPLRSLAISQIDKAHCFGGADAEGELFTAYLGWDGISDCKTLSFPCGESFGLLVHVKGETIRHTFGRNLTEIIPFETACCDDCGLDESCELTTDKILSAIQNNAFYVKNYFKAEKVTSCCPDKAPFDKINYQKFCITICDNGDSISLAKLQRQYPTFDIECVERKAPYTTYEVCIPCPFLAADVTAIETAETDVETAQAALDTARAAVPQVPVDIANAEAALAAAQLALIVANETAQTNAAADCLPAEFIMNDYALVSCDECPNGFTLVPAGIKVLVQMPYDGTTVIDAATALAHVQGSIPTATKATLLGCESATGTFEVVVPSDFDFATAIADVKVTRIGEAPATCTQDKAMNIAWSPCGNAYKISRKLCLIKKNDECDSDELDEIIEYYSTQTDLVAGSLVVESSNDCMTKYTVEQVNNSCLEDGCDTYGKDGAKFERLPSFEGILWKECDCEGWTFDETGCPVAPVEDVSNCLCGIKFTGARINRETLACTYDIWDQVEREQITLEVSIIDQYEDDVCDSLDVDWTVVQWGKAPDGLGQFVGRQETLSRNYDGYLYFNPKASLGNLLQQRLGYEYGFDPQKTYNHISLYHNYRRNGQAWHSAGHGSNRELIKLYVDSENTVFLGELKTFLNATLLSHGVSKLL